MRFTDRGDAGGLLADRLGFLRAQRPVVVAIAPGGVPVGFEVALRLGAPLDIVGVHAVGAPLQPKVAIGAVGEHQVRVLNRGLIKRLSVAARGSTRRPNAPRPCCASRSSGCAMG